MEIFTWHDEVVPTSVQLLASAGADCIAVLKPNIGVREYDVYDELHRWAPGVKLIHGLDRIEEELKKDIKLVIVDTVEDLGEKSEIKMDHALRALADAPSRPQVVLGCHNLAKHLMSLERVRRMWPDRRITSLVFTPAQKRSYVAAAAAYEAANGEEVPFDPVPIQSVPFYFGQDTIYGTLNKGFDASETSLLGIGALSQKRRDYTVLEQLQGRDFHTNVALDFFGVDKEGITEYLGEIHETHLKNVKINLESGTYKHLYELASKAAYVVLYLDNHTSDAVAAYYDHKQEVIALATENHDEYVEGKLSSALAVAIGFLTPVIGCSEVLEAFGIKGQMELLPDGSNFGNVMEEAIRIFKTDQGRYDRMRSELCVAREDLFLQARERVHSMLMAHA